MSIGLLVTALINLILGFTTSFAVFVVLWAINGWAQAMGAAPCVVSISRWFGNKERGTFYGLWSSSHNIGEAITFIVTSAIVARLGWQWGFRGAAILALIGFAIVAIFMRDTPQSCGLPSIADYKGDMTAAQKKEEDGKSVGDLQKAVLKNPAVWILALASAFMYISRYAVNSWGIFYLEAQKGYSIVEASSIISISSVCGILGTISSGWISDKFFGGKRNLPAVIFGLMNILGLGLFLFGPSNQICIIASMIIFGLAIGALICFLGGLMAVDIVSKKASGAALGVVGIASYVGAGIQDLVSGITIQSGKVAGEGAASYDFSVVSWFWLGAAILSVVCTIVVWRMAKKKKD